MLSSSFSFLLVSGTIGDDSLGVGQGGIEGGGNSSGARDGGGGGTDGAAALALLSPETWDAGGAAGKGQQGQGSPGRRLPFRPCSQQCWSC